MVGWLMVFFVGMSFLSFFPLPLPPPDLLGWDLLGLGFWVEVGFGFGFGLGNWG